MNIRVLIASAAVVACCGLLAPHSVAAASGADLDTVVRAIEAEPYQPVYVPIGTDSAFPDQPTPNTLPVQDYTSGSIPGSPDSPAWPTSFTAVTIASGDGAPLVGMAALHPGSHPGVVVVHGFNTHGSTSVIRWAALLYSSGYDVAAIDQRDFSAAFSAQKGYPTWLQTFGWKESEDVLAVGTWLHSRPGVLSVGILGFSEGAQNTVLAIGRDTAHVFSAALAFSGPADQDTQIASTAVPPGCSTPTCSYPATDALIALVVPPYSYNDPCAVLADAAKLYREPAHTILARESAMHTQTAATIPLLDIYANDDPLVNPVNASLMAAYQQGNPLQRTLEIQRGNHAYFYDRWWQQRTILLYFHALLAGASTTTTTPTVNQTPGGTPVSGQLVDPGSLSRAAADALLARDVCDTSKPPPGLETTSSPGGTVPSNGPTPATSSSPQQPLVMSGTTASGAAASTGVIGAGVTVTVLTGLALRRRRRRAPD